MCHKENQRGNRTGVNRLHLLDTKAFWSFQLCLFLSCSCRRDVHKMDFNTILHVGI